MKREHIVGYEYWAQREKEGRLDPKMLELLYKEMLKTAFEYLEARDRGEGNANRDD